MSEEREDYGEEVIEGTAGGVAVEAALAAGMEIGTLKAGFKQIEICETPGLIMPEGLKVEWLEKLRDRNEQLRPRPRTLTQQRRFTDLVSFCDYVNEFKDPNTRLYGSEPQQNVVAIMDDHEAAGTDGQIIPQPRWNRHVVMLDLRSSEEWQAWVENNKRFTNHLEFVEFLQEQISCIARPDASGIISAARTFSASRNLTFDSVMPDSGGDLSVAFSEDVRGTTKVGAAALPSALTLSLRPFRYLKAYEVTAMIRWRLSREGELKFAFTLLGLERVLEQAFSDVRGAINNATDLKVLL